MRFNFSYLTLCLSLTSPFVYADTTGQPKKAKTASEQPIERIQVNGSALPAASQTNAETEQLLKVAGAPEHAAAAAGPRLVQ